jgi:cobalt-zinc-cadmium efflux system outer membrane protein
MVDLAENHIVSLIHLACAVGSLVVATQSARAQDSSALGLSRQPLTLAQVLRAVAERHPLVLAAEARVSATRGMRLTAGSWTNPIVTHEVENAAWPGSDAPAASEREIMTSAMIPLEPLYQRWSRVARAEAEVRAAEAGRAGVQRNVQLDAARAFYRVALAQVAVRAATDIQRWLDSLVVYTQARVGEGVTAESDLMRLQVERDRAGAESTMRQVDLIRATAELQSHLGAPHVVLERAAMANDEWAVVHFSDTILAPETRPLATLVAIAHERRPELVEARERVVAARSTRTGERTLIVRELSAMIGTKLMGGQRSLMAGVSAPLPLFDQNRGEIRRASAEREAAEYERAWAERTVSADVSAAYEAVRALSARALSLQHVLIARAEEARRITLGAYAEGATTLLQVLDAARTLAEARVSFYELLFAQHESVLELRSAVGLPMHDDNTTVPAPASPSGRGAP